MSFASKHLVLVGGGHTHALLLNRFAAEPLTGWKVTLVSDVREAPYSGMLPGHVAGYYSHGEMHIDLPALCERAGAHFIEAKVNGLDTGKRLLFTGSGEALDLEPELLSLNIGSTPNRSGTPGAEEFAIPSKPVPDLLAGWESLRERSAREDGPLRVVVVGGGAGGVELTLAMCSQLPSNVSFTIIQRSDVLLSGHNSRVKQALSSALKKAGVIVRYSETVTRVEASQVFLESGVQIETDAVFWVTQPSPPDWLTATGLPLTERGFIRVFPTLRSVAFPWIFAAGDIATIEDQSLPKSGVYAVRMAVPLEKNLRAYAAGSPLIPYHPQKRILSLIGTADGKAVASWGPLAWRSRVMWKWKDSIDRKFMRQFES
jgi:pyridine nucleotide-disulfide oxidoreductase family protein